MGTSSPPLLDRRRFLGRPCAVLVGGSAWGFAGRAQALEAGSDAALVRAFQAGGCVLMLRHAQTEPGVGDPPGFELSRCNTQRQLSAAGRQQADRLGAWFRRAGLAPAQVRSSAWCRCRDTAQIAFGGHQLWPVLNSTFQQNQDKAEETRLAAAMDEALLRVLPGRFEVWVTHQVNISAYASQFTGMGDGVVVGGKRRMLGLLKAP